MDSNEVFWCIEHIRKHVEDAKKSPVRIRSEPLVVHRYSARLSLDVKEVEGRLWIGLYFHLIPGPNDSQLQWPFDIPYAISFIHPEDARRTKQWKITPLAVGFSRCFQEPRSDEQEGCGAPQFCTVEDARNGGYIRNGAVSVSVTFHA